MLSVPYSVNLKIKQEQKLEPSAPDEIKVNNKLMYKKHTDSYGVCSGAGNYKHGKLEFVASNLTFAVVKQIAHFFDEQFKLIATMVEIIDNQPHSYTYYIIFSLFDL